MHFQKTKSPKIITIFIIAGVTAVRLEAVVDQIKAAAHEKIAAHEKAAVGQGHDPFLHPCEKISVLLF